MSGDSIAFQAISDSLSEIPEVVAHSGNEPPVTQDIFMVPGHEKALNIDTTIVVGDRGSGKSFWCAALNADESRKLIGSQFPRLRLERCSVSWGFSARRGVKGCPSRQVLKSLVANDVDTEVIWRTVILDQLVGEVDKNIPGKDWYEKTQFVEDNPEEEEALLAEVDEFLLSQGRRYLIVFDALDRLGEDWASIRNLLQGLLRVCLDLRSFSAIRTKLFMRPDMWEDKSVWAFPDASKLHHNCVMLEWRRVDLYGLLWHWLANHREDSGKVFRTWVEKNLSCHFSLDSVDSGKIYIVPQFLQSSEEKQAELLNSFSSEFMGTNRRRGKTYTWLPTHLADARGQVSPRSFLIAIKKAHEASKEKKSAEVLHYDGIKRGVIKASDIRLQELKEDYVWIDSVFVPLRGLSVPVEPAELKKKWKAGSVINDIEKMTEISASSSNNDNYLPPHSMEGAVTKAEKHDALIQALIDIGVANRIPDGRLNIPDLFRVAAGMGRKGGVKR
ncbi:hypothetical protein ACT3UM_16660 [Halomonas sp. AOP13-D3-9]